MLSFNIFNMKIKIEYKIMAKEYGEMFLDSFLELAKEKRNKEMVLKKAFTE